MILATELNEMLNVRGNGGLGRQPNLRSLCHEYRIKAIMIGAHVCIVHPSWNMQAPCMSRAGAYSNKRKRSARKLLPSPRIVRDPAARLGGRKKGRRGNQVHRGEGQ
ncbi:unnamed protein product [Ectocarpus sp. 12 AP-2014]